MKLLLDQGLPRSAARLLRDQGIDAIHVGEIGMAAAEDSDILTRGSSEGRIIVTLDADFHALLALSGASLPSVIRLRIEGLKGDRLAGLLKQVVEKWDEELELGAMLTIEPARLRIRRLPIISRQQRIG